MSAVETEIASQPELWARAAALASEVADQLPEPGARLAVIGCGTSLFMAQAYATVLAISRSGTTTEVVRALEELGPGSDRVAISTAAGLPVVDAAQRAVLL